MSTLLIRLYAMVDKHNFVVGAVFRNAVDDLVMI